MHQASLDEHDSFRAWHLEVFADYFQIYVEDATCDILSPGDGWNASTRAAGVIMLPGMLNIAAARNMSVPLTLEIWSTVPTDDSDAWDRVTEAGLALASGVLVVSSPLGIEVARIEVPSGTYSARVAFAGLASLSDDGLEGSDRYRVQIWPGVSEQVVVKKQCTTSW